MRTSTSHANVRNVTTQELGNFRDIKTNRMKRKPKRVGVPESLRKFLGKKSLAIPAHTAEILPLQEKLRPLLKRAWPQGSERDISFLTCDLAGLWEVSRLHIILVRRLLKTSPELSETDLRDIVMELHINWLSTAPGHIKDMKRKLAQFDANLYGNGKTRKAKRSTPD
jgi:hypothetical protein